MILQYPEKKNLTSILVTFAIWSYFPLAKIDVFGHGLLWRKWTFWIWSPLAEMDVLDMVSFVENGRFCRSVDLDGKRARYKYH
jgi:hypothetical protein